MSFILQALERAERERRMGTPPDLAAAPEVVKQESRRHWPWLVVGVVLLVNATVLAALLWPWGSSMVGDPAPVAVGPRQVVERPPTPTVADPPRVAVPAAGEPRDAVRVSNPVELPVEPVLSPTPVVRGLAEEAQAVAGPPVSSAAPAVAVPTGQAAVEAVSVAVAEEAQAVVGPPVSSAAPAAEVPTGQAVSGAAAEDAQAAVGPPVSSAASAAAVPTGRAAVEAASVAMAEPVLEAAAPTGLGEAQSPSEAVPVAQPVDPEHSAEPDPGIPHIDELPASVRLRLGDFNVNVHVYAADPGQRFVLINMRKYREGERIGRNGPTLNRITPTAVVIDYGEGLARL